MKWLNTYQEWSTARIIRHIVYWLGWSTFYVLVNYLTGDKYDLFDWAYFEATVLPIKISCAYVIAYYAMPRFLYPKKYLLFAISTFLILMFFGSILYKVYIEIIVPCILKENSHSDHVRQHIYKAVELIHISSLVVGIKFFQNILFEQDRNQQLLREKVEAELKYLKNQVQPHFLFNTLNNIYGMVLSNDQQAPEAIVKLSDMLSYMLYDSEREVITLSSEIDNLENFMDLERLRYQPSAHLSL